MEKKIKNQSWIEWKCKEESEMISDALWLKMHACGHYLFIGLATS